MASFASVTLQRGETRVPLTTRISTPADEDENDAQSEISPEAFGIATPPRDCGPAAREAGGSALGDALGSAMAQLAAANATIAGLRAQLGATLAELALRSEMQVLAVKHAALEGKHESQAEIGLLRAERQSAEGSRCAFGGAVGPQGPSGRRRASRNSGRGADFNTFGGNIGSGLSA